MTEVMTDLGRLPILRRETRRRLVIGISLALVLAAGVAALFLVQGVDAQVRDVQHTHELRRQAGELVQSLVDAETGQRGYLLTQDDAYLEPYRNAVTTLDATYRKLLEMVESNPSQRVRISSLAEAIEQKRAEMATTISMANENRLREALTILRSGAGRTLMGRIRSTLEIFIAEEDSQLVERNFRVDSSRLGLTAAILLALAGAAVLTYTLFVRTQQQVSSLARTSSMLQSQNVELELRVKERTLELEEARAHAERERARVEALLQDTNHRIGNPLATVSSLLGLQVARTDSPEVKSALEAAQNRVHAIASGHRRLRLGDDLETTNVAEFLEAVIEDLHATQGEGRLVKFDTSIAPLIINARDATTLGIIVGELVINALKHAFPEDTAGHIWTRFEPNPEGGATLVVEDDGRGLPAESGEGGLGVMIIRQLAMQFGGDTSSGPRPDGGTSVLVRLPELEIVQKAT
jgi:two-component sensor histidine kinase/CHASE3 domain sensor protein